MKLVVLLSLALSLSIAKHVHHIPNTSLAQAAFSQFLNLMNPFLRPSQCLFVGTTLRQIALDTPTLIKFQNLAALFYQNSQVFNALLQQSNIVIDQGTAKIFFSILPVPQTSWAELQSSETIEILMNLLDEYFQVKVGTTAIYNTRHKHLRGCVGVKRRLEADSPSERGGICDAERYKYYQIAGACLNPNNSGAGLSFREMTRLGQQFCTSDGQSSLCRLPSVRKVSLETGEVRPGFTPNSTALVPNLLTLYWGQFVVHETSQGLETGSFLGGPATAACAKNGRPLWKDLNSRIVDSLDISCDDPFYSKFGVRCLDFVRNRRLNERCRLQRGNFVNSATAVLDLNTIYQWFNATTHAFETTMISGGKLAKNADGEFITPYLNNNQHTLLAVVDVLIANMHDKIVDELVRLNTTYNDEELFNKARQINVAFYQHVFYVYILPLFVGRKPLAVTSTNDTFIEGLTPQIFLEYTAAAGRFTHFLVTDFITLANPKTYQTVATVMTKDTFDNVELAQQEHRSIVCGSAAQPWRTKGVSDQIQNFLFWDKKLGYGSDLISVDIKRSQDACLEPYINYLQRIFGICIKSWEDLIPHLGEDNVKKFKKLYKRVEDLELYPAGIAEGGGVMGKTFTYLTIKQYENLRFADPKFYTHSLNKRQLREIVKMDLNKFACISAKLQFALNDMRFGYVKGVNDVVKCKCRTLKQCFDLKVFL